MAKVKKVFWVASKYDKNESEEVDEFLHDEIQNSILDYLEEKFNIYHPTTVDLIELTEEEYKELELQEDELLFVYGPLPIAKHPRNRTFIPEKVAFDVLYVHDNGTTVFDNEHIDGWQERTFNENDDLEDLINS